MSGKIIITDSAEEISLLWGKIQRLRGSSAVATWEAISTFMNVKNESLLFTELLGVLARRLSQLRQLVLTTKHPAVGETYRTQLSGSIDALGSWITPSNLNNDWSFMKDKVHRSDIGLVASFGHVARAHRPLRLVSEEEVKGIVEQITVLLEELETENELVPWASQMIRSSLTQTLIILRYLPIFGHEVLVDGLGDLKEKTYFLQVESEKKGDQIATPQGKATLLKTANVVIFALNLVAVPPQAEEYSWWYASKAMGLYENFLTIEHSGDDDENQRMPNALPAKKKEDDEQEQ